MSRRPFALIEVCVALIILSVVTTYLFMSGLETLKTYQRLTDEVNCHEIADETFSTLLATYLITPPEFDSLLTKTETTQAIEKRYIITTEVGADTPAETATQPVTRLHLNVTVYSSRFPKTFAERSTTLCVVKGELTGKREQK